MRVSFSVVLLVLLACIPRVSAQSLDPAWGVSEPVSEPASSPGRRRMGMYGGLDLGVPIILDTDRDLVRPGVNLHGQGGLDFGYVAGFVHGGFRWVPVDFQNAESTKHPEYEGLERAPLKNGYFGFGVRVQVPNRSRVLPYLSGSFDFNFWNFYEEQLTCVGYYYWWCTEQDVYRFTPGFSGRAGIAVRVRNTFYLDLGLGASMSFEGDFFDRNEVWLEPFFGVMQRL